MAKNPTMRSLARRLRLSTATVSEALRGSLKVNPATRLRVEREASRVGYRPNPLLGAALSAVRRAAHHDYRGTLALVDTTDSGRKELMVFHQAIIAGAEARAESLGFKTELFWLGEEAGCLSPARLRDILHARGIGGLVLLPFNTARDLAEFDFDRFAAVQMDHCLVQPQLHTILPEHYISMIHALERLTRRGYERIGLCLEHRKDARLKSKWSAAFLAFPRTYARATGLPALIEAELTQARFTTWFQAYRPDVIVGHVQSIVDWLGELRVRVPADVGFFNLNMTERTAPCAGLDLEPRRLGAAAIETVVAMLHRQERGVPQFPQTITLEASWIEGPTIREA